MQVPMGSWMRLATMLLSGLLHDNGHNRPLRAAPLCTSGIDNSEKYLSPSTRPSAPRRVREPWRQPALSASVMARHQGVGLRHGPDRVCGVSVPPAPSGGGQSRTHISHFGRPRRATLFSTLRRDAVRWHRHRSDGWGADFIRSTRSIPKSRRLQDPARR